jgi:6-phosphofructokinase 1
MDQSIFENLNKTWKRGVDSLLPRPDELEDLSIPSLGEATVPSVLDLDPDVYVDNDQRILVYSHAMIVREYLKTGKDMPMFEVAGPRQKMYFNPSEINCGIVTCGGLCPGLNDVIRTVVLSLVWQYGVKKVLGFRYGFKGLSPHNYAEPFELTPESVDGIQNSGGTILGSSRGPQDPKDMVDTLEKYQIKILFTIGGDGTFRGARDIVDEIKRRDLKISVIAIPKTIDNDIYCSERTFGFNTAIEEARKSIYIAHEEAKAAWNGIGLVKLMGRDSGFITAYATLANSDVNFCFIPEAPFALEGEEGFLKVLERRLQRRHHAVIVVAEGAGQDLIQKEHERTDRSGNVMHDDIGLYLKDQICSYFQEQNMDMVLKYINPSYTIRSCPANADDSVFCIMLGKEAVHAGMAGKTDMFVGYWNHSFTHVPLKAVHGKRKYINIKGSLWQKILEIM